MKILIITIAVAFCATAMSGTSPPKKERREAPRQPGALLVIDPEEVRVIYHSLKGMEWYSVQLAGQFAYYPQLARAFEWRADAYASAASQVAKLLENDYEQQRPQTGKTSKRSRRR